MKQSFLSWLSLFLFLDCFATSYSANVIPFERIILSNGGSNFKSFAASNESFGFLGLRNVRYAVNITLNNVQFRVLLDTGSNDLYITPNGNVGNFNDTGLPLTLSYGTGDSSESGTIGIAPFQLGQFNIRQQAFLNATQEVVGPENPDLQLYGLLGLGLAVQGGSNINDLVQMKYGSNATWGNPVLQNLFRQYPEQPNFIAMDLSRTDDLESTDGGSFTIGEYDDKYKDMIVQAPKLPQYPPFSDAWTTVLDGINVKGSSVSMQSSVDSVPPGKTLANLDSGTPTAVLPTTAVDQIYQSIPGAVKYNFSADLSSQIGEIDTGENWIVPCNGTTDVEFVFGGQTFPIHPLDLSNVIQQPFIVNGNNYTFCYGALTSWNSTGSSYDMLVGDSILRNMYSVYDFGDLNSTDGSTGNPYMQLLAKTNITDAITDAVNSRANTLSARATELSPSQLISLLTSESNTTSSTGTPSSKPSSSAPPISATFAGLIFLPCMYLLRSFSFPSL